MLITGILKNLKFSKNFQTHCTWSRCEDFVKFLSPSLSELKVTPNFCFALKFRDDVTASSRQAVDEDNVRWENKT